MISPSNLESRHYEELKASGIGDPIIERYFYSTAGESAQYYLIQPALDKLGAHASQYVTASYSRLLDKSAHVTAGGWVCAANGTLKPDEPRQAIAKQEDGSYLPVFNKGGSPKLIKYESIREKPYRGAYVSAMMPVDEPIRLADGSIAVGLPEGGKKCGALASIGYLSIPLPSVTLATYTEGLAAPTVIPAISNLIADGAANGESYTFIVCFDADEKKATRQNVAKETLKLADAIKRAGGKVAIASWKHSAGKGIDDVLVAKGDQFVHSLISDAKSSEEWRAALPKGLLKTPKPAGYKLELARLEALHAKLLARPKADVTLNQRYLDRGVLGAPGSIELIDSPISTGKTSSFLSGIVDQHRQEYPDAVGISSASRNILLRQSNEDLDFTHWLDTDGDPSLAKFRYLSACPESLPKLAGQSIPPNSLFLLDEIVADLSHVFCSDTMRNGADRMAVIKSLKTLLWKVLGGGGWVIGLEANIPQWAIDCLKELAPENTPIKLTRNEYQFKVNQKAYFYDNLTAFKAEQQTMALKGVKLCMASDSATQIDRQYRKMFSPLSSFFISAENSSDADAQEFATNPRKFLLEKKIRYLGFSPSIGPGTSIVDAPGHAPFFDAVTGTFTHLTSSAATQQTGRYRRPVPLHIYCQKSANGIGDADLSIFDPDALLQRWRDDVGYCHDLINAAEYLKQFSDGSLCSILKRSLSGDQPEVELMDRWRSIITASDNFDKLHLQKNLKAKLAARGYENVDIECASVPGASAEFKEMREQAEAESGAEFAALEVPEDMSPDEARTILSSHGHTRAESLQARKCLYQFEFPNCDFSNAEFCTEWLIKNKGKKLNQLRVEWAARNPAAAKAIDRWHLKGKLKQAKNLNTGISAADLSQMSPAADVFARSGLPSAIDAIGADLYSSSHPDVMRVASWVDKNKPVLSKVFRMRFDEDRSNVDVFNSFARKLGYMPKQEKNKGKDGDREKAYILSDFCNPDRAHMLNSLTQKFTAKLEQKGESIEGKTIKPGLDWGASAEELKKRVKAEQPKAEQPKTEKAQQPKPQALEPKLYVSPPSAHYLDIYFEEDLIKAQTFDQLIEAKAKASAGTQRRVMKLWEKDGRLTALIAKRDRLKALAEVAD